MKIEWTEPAVMDLAGIQEYIGHDSEYYAAQFIEKIIESVESLDNFPGRGRQVPEAKDRNIRELLFNNYRIIYHIEVNRVLILTIIHAARNLKDKDIKPWDVC